jgi:hypothetical protein
MALSFWQLRRRRLFFLTKIVNFCNELHTSPSYFIVNKVQSRVAVGRKIVLQMGYPRFKLDKAGYLIHLQDKIGHSSKKIEQSQQYFRFLTLEN